MIFPETQLPVLQNRVFASQYLAIESPTGSVKLKEDPHTGIISNVLYDPSILNYDENYDNEQSNSRIFQSHLSNVYGILKTFIQGKKVIEVGCGKGQFLNLISNKGHEIYGCDPTYVGSDYRIIKEFFSKELGLQGDLIILRHVLEHIQDPVVFLLQIAAANNNQGLIYIEVPDFNWILENDVYFDVFYEHVNYFRPDDFKRIFANILKSGTFFDGQYQYVIADLSSIVLPPYSVGTGLTKQLTLNTVLKTVELLKEDSGSDIYIWGAASKGVISGIYLTNLGIQLTGIIDINKRKQGKYVAITGLRVISPDEFNQLDSKATILIANPNYTNEIKEMVTNKEHRYINL